MKISSVSLLIEKGSSESGLDKSRSLVVESDHAAPPAGPVLRSRAQRHESGASPVPLQSHALQDLAEVRTIWKSPASQLVAAALWSAVGKGVGAHTALTSLAKMQNQDTHKKCQAAASGLGLPGGTLVLSLGA